MVRKLTQSLGLNISFLLEAQHIAEGQSPPSQGSRHTVMKMFFQSLNFQCWEYYYSVDPERSPKLEKQLSPRSSLLFPNISWNKCKKGTLLSVIWTYIVSIKFFKKCQNKSWTFVWHSQVTSNWVSSRAEALLGDLAIITTKSSLTYCQEKVTKHRETPALHFFSHFLK